MIKRELTENNRKINRKPTDTSRNSREHQRGGGAAKMRGGGGAKPHEETLGKFCPPPPPISFSKSLRNPQNFPQLTTSETAFGGSRKMVSNGPSSRGFAFRYVWTPPLALPRKSSRKLRDLVGSKVRVNDPSDGPHDFPTFQTMLWHPSCICTQRIVTLPAC